MSGRDLGAGGEKAMERAALERAAVERAMAESLAAADTSARAQIVHAASDTSGQSGTSCGTEICGGARAVVERGARYEGPLSK